jgi:membrane protein implicated in regulation of membrane protease activity
VPDLLGLFLAHPFWGWLSVGVVLLVGEAATGAGWLQCPAVAAGLTSVVILTDRIPQPAAQVGLCAGLTLVIVLTARPWQSRPARADLTDRALRVVGRTGEARADFVAGHGRVLVDGAEWLAELEGGGELVAGASVRVVRAQGARLIVGPA